SRKKRGTSVFLQAFRQRQNRTVCISFFLFFLIGKDEGTGSILVGSSTINPCISTDTGFFRFFRIIQTDTKNHRHLFFISISKENGQLLTAARFFIHHRLIAVE
ncbi:MAG: hypothetical protein IJK98_03885, partial [Clostridia bacterium]|nr:hypothetical protein [Clostridia bacterium]